MRFRSAASTPRPWSITSSTAKPSLMPTFNSTVALRGEYLIAFDNRLSTIVRNFSPSPITVAGRRVAWNVTMRASAASRCSFTTRVTMSGNATGPSAAGAFAHRGKRRLELVRDVAQKSCLLLLEIGQPAAQPVEPLADVAQILRSGNLDRVREVRAAHLPNREV